MVFYLTLFLVFWALIYTAARFLQYYRIVRDYKDTATAVVARTKAHVPGSRREKPAVDVVLEYDIDGKPGSSEIVVPADRAGDYEPGTEVGICYYVSGNGAVHIASAGGAPKKLMYGYLAAIILELLIYYIIWRIML